VKDFTAQWFRSEIDLCELAKLRKAGWTTRALAAHFGISNSSIVDRLKKLAKEHNKTLPNMVNSGSVK
jgi:lambda repressor-like predicted transcriptional regulator